MLLCSGFRWVTITIPTPGSAGIPLKRPSRASTPPADAPTPTMGKAGADPVIGIPHFAGRLPSYPSEWNALQALIVAKWLDYRGGMASAAPSPGLHTIAPLEAGIGAPWIDSPADVVQLNSTAIVRQRYS